MTGRERLLTALNGRKPDRLPVTTHHVMPYFLDRYLGGVSVQEFFDRFGLDAIKWVSAIKPNSARGERFYNEEDDRPFFEQPVLCSDNWRLKAEPVDQKANIVRFGIETPSGNLGMVLQSNDQTSWVLEPLIKQKREIEILASYAPSPLCDVESVNLEVSEFGDRGIVRGAVPGFDIYGQPGCWQDAAVLFGIENLIMETFTDPQWVKEFLEILKIRKAEYLGSTTGAKFDLLELGGGSASTTVISPNIFNEFVAPYDAELIEIAHANGQKIVYHTCGGMMPILESIAGMKPDVMETFTPPSMGGDADLAEARRRLGDDICMIGGFDQFHYFTGCTPGETRAEVRRCFEAAGKNGAYILAPSDHFFEADMKCLEAFADEAGKCKYD